MNQRAMLTENPAAVNTVYNTAVGDRTTIKDMAELLKQYLSEYDPAIRALEILHGPVRAGDVPHSKASIEKAKELLGYEPSHTFAQGLKEAVHWYWKNLKGQEINHL